MVVIKYTTTYICTHAKHLPDSKPGVWLLYVALHFTMKVKPKANFKPRFSILFLHLSRLQNTSPTDLPINPFTSVFIRGLVTTGLQGHVCSANKKHFTGAQVGPPSQHSQHSRIHQLIWVRRLAHPWYLSLIIWVDHLNTQCKRWVLSWIIQQQKTGNRFGCCLTCLTPK